MRKVRESTRLYRVYRDVAIQELRELLRTSNKPAIQTVEEYIQKADRYSSNNLNSSWMFSIAKDVGLEVLDELLEKGAWQ
ncbi:MAG: hypothetical protein J6U54_11325 [Clostridiales bacterium]|nr:hypothetical protein [Clostridiales bacterium]